ncbi:DUF3052 domain-containing protein [Kitasatospora sp. NPDC004669]|uniref:DUF3052 domain-containing protein n=1 Tax=Kitasatospora sp. NPDC004669 TaxID=3154555 RepID=UPI0033A691BD
MAVSKEELAERALRLGFEHGMVVREVGYDDRIDQGLHDSVDVIAGQALLDLDWDGLADAVLLWFRDEDDEDLADTLDYALDLLGERGIIWLLTPKAGRAGHVEPGVVEIAVRAKGLSSTETMSVADDWNGSCLTSGGHRP